MNVFIPICFFMLFHQSGQSGTSERIKDWQGCWVVERSGSSIGKTCPTELMFLTDKGAEILVKGNELIVSGKILGTLTTDFSGTGLDLEKAVWVSRRPVMITTPMGRGVLCAYETNAGVLEICYPHTQGRVGAGTRIILKSFNK